MWLVSYLLSMTRNKILVTSMHFSQIWYLFWFFLILKLCPRSHLFFLSAWLLLLLVFLMKPFHFRRVRWHGMKTNGTILRANFLHLRKEKHCSIRIILLYYVAKSRCEFYTWAWHLGSLHWHRHPQFALIGFWSKLIGWLLLRKP